jgi:hypothetical protein
MTSIEWLVKEIETLITIETFQKWKDIKEQSKEMHKQEIIDAYNKGAIETVALYNQNLKKDYL